MQIMFWLYRICVYILSVQCHHHNAFCNWMMSREVEAEREVMVEARGWDEDWEETHVVKLR